MSDRKAPNRRTPLFRLRVQRPDTILDAALELFLKRGYAEGRLEDIAKLAGVSKPALYNYFASKQALLEAVVARYCLPELPPAADSPEAMLQAALTEPRASQVLELVINERRPLPELGAFYVRAVLGRVAQWPEVANLGSVGSLTAQAVGRAALAILFGGQRDCTAAEAILPRP